MRIVHLTPGTGDFYCGSCLRDNALARALRTLGHDALLVPLYLPHVVDEKAESDGVPIFFGGINVYLQQKSALFRKTPPWLDKLFDSATLLRAVARRAGMTSPREVGELTLSMLRAEEGRQRKEFDKLTDWLAEVRPDVVGLSNSLLVGFARPIKTQLGAPVICSLQGEDGFLDSLPEPYRTQCLEAARERARDVDLFVAPSRYYQEIMAARLKVPTDRIAVVYNGIDLTDYAPRPLVPDKPVIGFLSRMCREKGLHTLVEAFIRLKKNNRVPGARLHIAGTRTDSDARYVGGLLDQLRQAGCEEDVDWSANIDRRQKIAFLQSLSVLSVPATYGEAFGIYLIEAWAAGVPVVQPRNGAFPEMVEATGGGLICKPDDPGDLAATLENLLLDREQVRVLGERGRATVLDRFHLDAMARSFAEICERVAGSRAPQPDGKFC